MRRPKGSTYPKPPSDPKDQKCTLHTQSISQAEIVFSKKIMSVERLHAKNIPSKEEIVSQGSVFLMEPFSGG